MKKIRYIGFYDVPESNNKRNFAVSAANKMNYIISALNANNINVQIISLAMYTEKNAPITKKIVKTINENIELILSPSFAQKNRVFNRIRHYLSKIWLFFWLIFNVEKNEEIIVYHSLALITPVFLAKKIKGFKVIYEVEEIYSDVSSNVANWRKRELRAISNADKYIFSTELLDQKINKDNKASVIVHGTYKVEKDRKVSFDDGKIHVAYTGTFDETKGGVYRAIEACDYLDKRYHMHIAGFGSDNQIEKVKKMIEEINVRTECEITYEGLLLGEEYISFLQKCDIGLSTQNPNLSYNETSFPSKVLVYLSNGLRVVSSKISVVEISKIGDLVYYDYKNTEESLAKAIKSVSLNDSYDSRDTLQKLHKSFIDNIEKLLEKIQS